jgi:hypothetical protein
VRTDRSIAPADDAPASPPRALLAGLSLVSGAALAYEILLTRLFSIIQWHHFAYMMISVALLGYGAAGAAVTLARERIVARLADVLAGAAVLFAVTAAGGFLVAQRVPFNPLEFLWDPQQPLLLLLIYLLLFVPFFFAALYVCLMFACFGRQAGRVYSFDILGAAAGCLGVLLALFVLPPVSVLGAIALCALCAAALLALARGRAGSVVAAGCVALGIGVAFALSGPLNELRLSPYKELSQTLEVMGARVVAARSSPLGWLTVVESPEVPLRHAPGLSLNAPGEPPRQLALFTDGEGLTPITRFDGGRQPLAYLDFVTSAAAYHVLERPRVLVLGAGAGADVLQALVHSAASIDAVELNPAVARLVERDFADFSGRPLSRPGVRLHIAEARAFATASRARYDLVQLALLDAFGASSAGLYALAESYLYTVESLRIYLRRLAPDGILSITRWVTLPPRDTLKLFGMAALALELEGASQPGKRLVLLRSWRTATLLIKNGDWSDAQIQRLKVFAAQRSFDFGWYPRMAAADADRYNILDRPYFYEGATALLGPERDTFIADYKFDIGPATDDRPYFFHFFRWRALPELLRLKGQGGLPLLEWGYPLLVATLLQAVVASAALILLPLWLLGRRDRVRPREADRWRVAVYFAAIGLAFMLVEIAFIQKFGLLLGHPLYAIAVVLFAFLLSAGLGSRFFERLLPAGLRIALPVLAIAAVSGLYAFLLLPVLLPVVAALPDAARIAIGVALILPLGFAMGMPFPAGLARVAASAGRLVPWAWGVNACASVIGAIAATLAAVHFGFTAVLIAAIALYAMAAACAPRPASNVG